MATLLRHLVVYDHPLDQPDYYVARWHQISNTGTVTPETMCYGFKDLDRLRGWIAQEFPDLTVVPRSENDTPGIIETWI